MGFPGGSMVKNPPANAGDTWDVGLIPGSEDPLENENDNPLKYSCLGIPGREEAGGLQSMGSQRVGHNACKFNSLSLLLNGKGKLNIWWLEGENVDKKTLMTKYKLLACFSKNK